MGKEKNCSWNFPLWNTTMTLHGPNDAIVQSFNSNYYDSLVRESIQNSLDAVYDKTKPVTVEFSFDTILKNDFPNLFEIENHVQGCLDYYSDNARARELYGPMISVINQHFPPRIDVIKVADYNTTGMSYDENNPKNPFSAFAKSVGFSLKTSKSSGGSFGFGKAAYFQMSPIRTILIASKSINDENSYFEGVSRLSTHEINHEMYSDVGYYDCNQGKPAKNDDIPQKFIRQTFGTDILLLGRFMNSDCVEVMQEELLKSVLTNFWLAIHNGKLVVKIGSNICINYLNVKYLIRKYFPFDSKNKKNPRPYFEAYVAQSDKDHLVFKKCLNTIGEISFYVIKDANAKKTRIAYMRKPRMLVETKISSACTGMYGLFLCLDEKGNEILSNIEDASHSSWSTKGKTGDAKNFAEKVLNEIEEFINECFQNIYESNDEVEYFDIGIGASENDLEGLLMESAPQNNPFNMVKTGDLTDDGGDIKNVKGDVEEVHPQDDDPERGNLGHGVKGKKKSDASVIKTVGTGHRNKQSKKKGGLPIPGNSRKKSNPDISEGNESFTLFTPVNFRVVAEKSNGVWIHNLILHIEEEINNVFIDVSVGAESGDEKISIKEVNMGSIAHEKGIIKFTKLPLGTVRIQLIFSDNMRHTIKLR